jgi:primosomal protein N'
MAAFIAIPWSQSVMAHIENTCQKTVENQASAQVATIMPANTAMPLECDACDHVQNYSMTFLRTQPQLTCKQCGDQRHFSAIELKVLEGALNNMGFYLSKSA